MTGLPRRLSPPVPDDKIHPETPATETPDTAAPGSEAQGLALSHHARHGRNPSSLVTLDRAVRLFEAPGVAGGVPYHAVGPVWLAGEPLAPPEALSPLMARFVAGARRAGRLPLFAPVGPLAAQAAPAGWRRVRLGVTAYLYAPDWQPRGNRFGRLRGELNRARRQGVSVRELSPDEVFARAELARLNAGWLGTRRAATAFDWIFRLAPQQHPALKRNFMAFGPDGVAVAYLSASPLPARRGWYLEDVIRGPTSPPGTTAALVVSAMQTLRAEGARWLTLGGVPLGQGQRTGEGLELGWLRGPLSRWYNFAGVASFKAQFGTGCQEDEWLLLPSLAALPLAAWAVTRLALPGGLRSLGRGRARSRGGPFRGG